MQDFMTDIPPVKVCPHCGGFVAEEKFCPNHFKFLGADMLLIVTDVPGAMRDYGGPGETLLNRLSVAEARRHLAAGHFPPGSMGPKVEACLRFMEGGGRRAAITSLETILEAVADKAVGTQWIGGSKNDR